MAEALIIKDVCKKWDDFEIKDIDIELPAKCVVGLAGDIGAGKSSLVKMIMDVIHPDSGEISVFGYDSVKDRRKIRNITGLALEEAFFPGYMNAMDVETTMKGLYSEWSPNRYSYMLDMLGVEKLRKIKKMEKPERVKLNLAVAMSHGTKLLIIDDILTDLDGSSIKSIVKALKAFVYDDGGSLFISSRVLGDFEGLCDYFAFMREGNLEFFDLKDNLMEQYASIDKSVDLDEIMLYINKKARHSAKGNMKNRNLKKKKGKK